MVNRLRTADWSRTPLGDVEHWPETLRVAVTMVHGSRFPMLICWGPELIQIYNDAFIPIYGGKHPQLGCRMQDTWAEVWPILEPMLGGVMATGVATWSENVLLWVERGAARDDVTVEDAYFSWSYSRIQGPDGSGAGIYVAATEATQQVLEDRRGRALAAITTGYAATREEAAHQVVAAMARHPDDVPFAHVYLPGEDGRGYAPVAGPGLGGLPAARDAAWPPAPAGADPEIVALPPGFPAVTHAQSGLPVTHAGVVALGGHGLLVCGLSPSRPRDEAHLRFLTALGTRVGAALGAGQAFADERMRSEQRLALARATIEREEAERSLAIAERFRFACRAANVGAWTLDLRTGRTELDENVELMFGLSPGTLDGSLDDIMWRIDDEDRDRVADAIAVVTRDGGEYVVEYRMTRPDGSRRAFQARGMATPGADGRPALLHGVLWDATELIAAQTASRESEERLRTALEAATWGSAIIHPDGRIAQVNQALCDLVGYDRDAIVGMCCQQLVHPDEERVPNPGGRQHRGPRAAARHGRRPRDLGHAELGAGPGRRQHRAPPRRPRPRRDGAQELRGRAAAARRPRRPHGAAEPPPLRRGAAARRRGTAGPPGRRARSSCSTSTA
ncbi:PAS domain-containing protein [Paraconexibacter antarcticus]|uniref:histidine kinase n=1 Tax=Paraconexibacter antarcticus TaxID=2949664 RepID=A0ABY5DMR7_9ACTN|nr:PAS domain-containing protein [Paraconexibacter antarcticus]UTI62710.1 PAS domain-containing protein [Paraconexibacter antarcticus]